MVMGECSYQLAKVGSMALTDNCRPSISSECTNCSNSPTTGGFIIGNAPSMMHCQCDNHIGYPKSRWPTAIIDISKSFAKFHYATLAVLTITDTVVDNSNGHLRCHTIVADECYQP
jgi:hypothetical protein